MCSLLNLKRAVRDFASFLLMNDVRCNILSFPYEELSSHYSGLRALKLSLVNMLILHSLSTCVFPRLLKYLPILAYLAHLLDVIDIIDQCNVSHNVQ